MIWSEQFAGPASGYMSNNMRVSKSAPCSPIKPNTNGPAARVDPFHVVYKVPVGDSPYVKAKHVQLVDRDPDRAIALFWSAINSGDRVDSALKDMAIVMKQQNRPQEAIEAIKSLRSRCSDQAQESLDNVLLDLFKRCGRIDDQIDLLKRKLHLIHQGMAFNGKRTKTARSQGKKFQVSVEQEATRLLGNLGWAYMQQSNFAAAEAVYRKALSIESDNNKVCNLGICLMKQGRLEEAKSMLQSVTRACHDSRWASESHLKSFERAQEMLDELGNGYHDNVEKQLSSFAIPGCDADAASVQTDSSSLWQPQPALPRQPRRMSRSTLEQQLISQLASVDPSMTGALLATSGFGPSPPDHTTPRQRGAANSTRLDMAGCFRIPQPGAAMHGERSSFQSQWWLQGGLEDEDLFDYSSPDESSDGSVDAQAGCQHDRAKNSSLSSSIENEVMQWRAETLLENVTALENAPLYDTAQLGLKAEADAATTSDLGELSYTVRDLERSLELVQPFNPIAFNESSNVHSTSTTDAAISPGSDASDNRHLLTSELTSGIHNGHHQVVVQDDSRRAVKPLLSAGMWTSTPFRSTHSVFENNWNRGDHDESQWTTPSRSLTLEFGGIMAPPLPYPQANSVGLPPLHAAPGKRISRIALPKKEDPTASTWDLMDFIYSPSDLAFDRANDEISPSKRECGVEQKGLKTSMGNLSASEMEMRRQGRLRVFQEMTPSKTIQV